MAGARATTASESTQLSARERVARAEQAHLEALAELCALVAPSASRRERAIQVALATS